MFDTVSDKEAQISFFKRGFGGDNHTLYRGIKYYNVEQKVQELTDSYQEFFNDVSKTSLRNSLNQKIKLLKNASLYGIFSFLSTAINFFLLPLYTYYLTPTEFGIRAVIQSLIGLLSIFYTLSLNMALMKFYSVYSSDKGKLNFLVSSIVNFVLLVSVLYNFDPHLVQGIHI
jgi:hypothetical protein